MSGYDNEDTHHAAPCSTARVALASLVFGQTFEVRSRSGDPVVAIENVKMFRYSDYFKEDIPEFRGIIRNVSKEKLLNVSIVGRVHKKDGTVLTFKPSSVSGKALSGLPSSLPEDFVHDAAYAFSQPWPFKPADFDSVEFILETAQRLTTKPGFHFTGFIAKDEGCFSDYLATKSLTGVALRKALVELVEYGCGFVVEKPQQAWIVEKTKKGFGVGAKKAVGVEVALPDTEYLVLGLDPPSRAFDSGWVLFSALTPGPVVSNT